MISFLQSMQIRLILSSLWIIVRDQACKTSSSKPRQEKILCLYSVNKCLVGQRTERPDHFGPYSCKKIFARFANAF